MVWRTSGETAADRTEHYLELTWWNVKELELGAANPVGTPVHVALAGDRALFRTWDSAWKFKRLRNNPIVTLRPSTFRGRPTGSTISAHARILKGQEARDASSLLTAKYP